MVIIAGYEEDINNLLFNINKGMDSRFIWRFKIENYNAKNLLDIFKKKIDVINWKLEENVINVIWFEDKMDPLSACLCVRIPVAFDLRYQPTRGTIAPKMEN